MHKFADGRIELSNDGRVVEFTVYDKRPRIDQGAIVGNKRLEDTLRWLQDQQEKDEPSQESDGIRIIRNNRRVQNNYKPTGKRGGNRPRKKDGTLLPPSTEGVGTRERTNALKLERKSEEAFQKRLAVIRRVDRNMIRNKDGATELGVSGPYMSSLVKRFRDGGEDALRPKRRGRPPKASRRQRDTRSLRHSSDSGMRPLTQEEIGWVIGGAPEDTSDDD